MRKLLLSLLLLPLLWGGALAQTSVQQSASRLDACTAVASAVGAVASQQTATITVSAGNYAYICAISLEVCTNATGTVQSNVTFTSTNLTGSPTWQYSMTATADICQRWFDGFASPLKSAVPGTNVTVVSPTSATNNNYGIRLYYYIAP
jgi:hypothetical protein